MLEGGILNTWKRWPKRRQLCGGRSTCFGFDNRVFPVNHDLEKGRICRPMSCLSYANHRRRKQDERYVMGCELGGALFLIKFYRTSTQRLSQREPSFELARSRGERAYRSECLTPVEKHRVRKSLGKRASAVR